MAYSPLEVDIERSPPRRDERPRTDAFAIDRTFEAILVRANHCLQGLESELTQEARPPGVPLVILCYPPRSGSTFLGQLLARTGRFNYVSNFVARFWEAPVFAARLERELRLRDAEHPHQISSTYGVTEAVHEPHEFGFFWNKWLRFMEPTHRIAWSAMRGGLAKGLFRQLSGLMRLDDRPFLVKSDLVGLNVELFHELFDDVRFLLLRRDPVFVAQSIYRARCDIYGDPNAYWSTRPSIYEQLLDLPTPMQIAGQIRGIYDDIEGGLETRKADVLEISYEQLCTRPIEELERICRFVGVSGGSSVRHVHPHSGNHRTLDPHTFAELERAIQHHFPKSF